MSHQSLSLQELLTANSVRKETAMKPEKSEETEKVGEQGTYNHLLARDLSGINFSLAGKKSKKRPEDVLLGTTQNLK